MLNFTTEVIYGIHILQPDDAISALKEISQIVGESDISPFEVIHSGLVRVLLNYLTLTGSESGDPTIPITESSAITNSLVSSVINFSTNIADSIESSLTSATAAAVDGLLNKVTSTPFTGGAPVSSSSSINKVPRDKRLRYFLHVFMGCSVSIK